MKYLVVEKDKVILKCFLGHFQFSQKTDYITMVPQVELFSFIFWEN